MSRSALPCSTQSNQSTQCSHSSVPKPSIQQEDTRAGATPTIRLAPRATPGHPGPRACSPLQPSAPVKLTVRDNQNRALVRRHGANASKHLLRTRGREDVPCHTGREEPAAHEADCAGLVPAAAAAEEGDAAAVRVCAVDHLNVSYDWVKREGEGEGSCGCHSTAQWR